MISPLVEVDLAFEPAGRFRVLRGRRAGPRLIIDEDYGSRRDHILPHKGQD